MSNLCVGSSLFEVTKSFYRKFEPSDLYFKNTTSTFLIVSDNGKLVEISTDGKLLRHWNLGKQYDLGITQNPIYPDIVYLVVEYPAQILQFDLELGEITQSWDIQDIIEENQVTRVTSKKQKDQSGIESITFIPNNTTHGYFYVGSQLTSEIYIFDLSSEIPTLRGSIKLSKHIPDLSSMTTWDSKLWLLFDKPKLIQSISIESITRFTSQSTESNSEMIIQSDMILDTLQFNARGAEGIAFYSLGDETHVLVAIDPPKSNSKKDILSFTLSQFINCFQTRE